MFFIKRFYVLFFCFVFALSTCAQDRNKATALKTILESIQKKHHVTFNYIDSEITKVIIIPPKKSLSLNQKLAYLHKRTKLYFENIDNEFINIFKSNPTNNNICGYVFSLENHLPLENANIQFSNNVGTRTNRKGYFTIKKEDLDELNISYVGFTSKTILISEIQSKNCSKFYLEPKVAELLEVKASHFLATGISKTLDGTLVIKPKKLGILPGLIEPDVLQTIQQIPGINSADESVASINVRGGTHDQNLFLWNGIKMYQTGHFFGLISAFNPYLPHTISLSKNGSSAFYGQSVSSVVDISSNPSKYEKNSISAGINMINADIYSKYNFNKESFVEIAARKSIMDLVQTPTYKQYYTKAFQNTTISNYYNKNTNYSSDKDFNFYDITAKYSQKINKKDRLIIDLLTISDQLKVSQSAIINNTISSEKNILYQKNYGGNISYNRNWNTKNSTHLNIYSSIYELESRKNKIESNQTSKQSNDVIDNGVKLENNHIINSKLNFNNGYQYNEIGITNTSTVNSPMFYKKNTDIIRAHAVILEGKYNDTISKIYLSTGLRSNYIEQFNKYLFEPRLQFNYGINQYLSLEVLGEFKSQYSFQSIDLQNDYFGIEKRHWILANNSTIPIQRSKQASIGFTFTKSNWLLTLDNFYKKVVGINSSSQGFQNQLEFEKINGNYEVFGTEILLQKKINNFITWLSYTYNDNNYYFPNYNHPVFSNNFELDHVVSWAGIYERNNLKIALGSKWYSGRPETTPSSPIINNNNPFNPTINYGIPNNKRLEDFLQVNFSATYRWEGSAKIQYKAGLSVLNIFDKQNEINEYYRVNTTSNTIDDIKIFALRRTPNLSFRAIF
jgi:hypothetical protein